MCIIHTNTFCSELIEVPRSSFLDRKAGSVQQVSCLVRLVSVSWLHPRGIATNDWVGRKMCGFSECFVKGTSGPVQTV